MSISRRSILRGAAIGALAPLSKVALAQETTAPSTNPPGLATDYPAALKSCAIFERVPDQQPNVGNTGTYDFGVSDLNEGSEGITACRWGIVHPVIKGGRVVELRPFAYDYAPSPNLQG